MGENEESFNHNWSEAEMVELKFFWHGGCNPPPLFQIS
jgi:hypothetical protein